MNFAMKPPIPGPENFGEYPPYGGGYPQGGGDDEALDIKGLLLPFWRRKWILVLSSIVAAAISTFVVLQMEPRYTAYARVIFDPERLRIIDLQEVIASQDITGIGLQNQVEILGSEDLLNRVVDILRLETSPTFNPELRTGPRPFYERVLDRVEDSIPPLPRAAEEFLVGLGLMTPPKNELLTLEEEKEILRNEVLKELRDGLTLRPIPNSRVIQIGFTSTSPAMAAAIINTIGEQYIVVQVEGKRDDVAAATELLSVRVRDLENRLASSEQAVGVARLDLAEQAGYNSDLTGQQLHDLNVLLLEARQIREQLENRRARLEAALESGVDLGSIPDFRASAIIDGFRVRESALRDEVASLRAIVGENHPNMKRAEAALAALQRNIRLEAENVVAAMSSELQGAADREDALAASLAELEANAAERSRAEMRLQQLEREAEANRVIYESFLTRMKETSEQAALQISDARFLTRAAPPLDPETASRRKVVLMAALAGMLAGAGIVFLLEKLNDTFRSPTDLEGKTGQTVLAAIPSIGKRKRPKQMVSSLLRKPNSALAESIRNMRTSILFSNLDQPPKVVMFTSSVPKEAKTTTSMLMAIASQQMGHSAIIVDCDLRRRTLSSIFPTNSDQPGLLAVLEGSSSIDDAVFEEPETGLHVLGPEPAGRGHGNPADILASQRFRRLIEELRSRYDLVILDTPPVLVVTDSRIVAQVADAVVYIVRWDSTSRGAVTEGLRELTSINARIAGLALTMVDEARAAKFVDNEFYYKRKYKKYITS